MIRVLYLFMMFSVIGWLWETSWVSLRSKKYINRGFLRGPYIPIYGCAVVTIILTMNLFNSFDSSNGLVILMQIVYMAVVTAIWEFVTSYVLEKLFKTRWWDYSSHKYNIQGRISLHVTVFFGLGGYTLYRGILPLFEELFTLVTLNQIGIILILFYGIFVIDSVITTIELFKTKHIISQIEAISKELSLKVEGKYQEFQLQYRKSKQDFTENVLELKSNLLEILKQSSSNTVTKRIKEDLNKISKTLSTQRRLNRFYKKYPNAKSFGLFRVKKTIEDLLIKRKER